MAARSPTLVVTSNRLVDHAPPDGHPERPGRAEVMSAVTARWRSAGGAVGVPRAIGRDAMTRVHSPDYVELISATAGQRVQLDPDTFTSPESTGGARLAATAAIMCLMGAGRPWLSFVRPDITRSDRGRWDSVCTTT